MTMNRHRAMLWVGLFAILALMVPAADALAAAASKELTLGNFRCSGGRAAGQLLLSSASCPTTLTFENLFSFLICNFEQLTSNLMGHMFCGMITELAPAVYAAATLAVVFFGISFTIGLTAASGGEAIKFLLKIAFITAFATNADLLIGYGYRFLIGGITDGVTIVLKTLSSADVNSSGDIYKEFDKFLAMLIHFATDMEGAKQNEDFCKNGVFAVIGLMIVALPALGYAALVLIGSVLITIFRAVFGYIYALVGIAFLLMLAPFFLSFYLFKQTTNFFDRWLSYLVSFTLQVILLFAFLGFVLLIGKDIGRSNVLTNLTDIIMYNSEQVEATSNRFSFRYCTLCDFKVVNKDDPSKPLKKGDADYASKGKLVCKDPKKPISPNFITSPAASNQVGNLLDLAGKGLIPLILLAIIMQKLLTLIPVIAQKLGSGLGATYAPQLGGGFPGSGAVAAPLPGGSNLGDFQAGFKAGYESNANRDGISKTVQGLKDGLSVLVTGQRSVGDQKQQVGEGVGGSFARWLIDPNRFGIGPDRG